MAAYDNILANYGQTASNILGGYGGLNSAIQTGLEGSNSSQMQDIFDQYTKAYASNKQDLISRGLRSTTRASTDSSSLIGQKWRAEGASRNALAQLQAGYAGQIGLAGLGAAGNFLNQGAQLGLGYGNLDANYQKLALEYGLAGFGHQAFGYYG